MRPAHDDDPESAALVLQRWGTRFADVDAEHRYREWQFARNMPGNRLNIAVAIALWATLHLTGLVYQLPGMSSYTPLLIGAYLSLGACALAVARRSVMGWRAAWRVANVVTVVVGLAGTRWFGELDQGALVVGVGMMGALYGLAATPVSVAGPGALTAVVGAEWLRADACAAGELSAAGLAVESVLLWMSLLTGVVVSLGTDRAAHTAYRQERIIEAQKQTITRERARTEELLRSELSHQVAERSRELGNVLATSGLTLDARALKPGERFAERYKIVSALGAGGMGAVYEVERVTDSARLALKVVVGEVSAASAARFAREAEIGARVRHRNIVSIVDVGVSSGVPFLVMEMVKGGSLDAQRSKFGDAAWALPIVKQMAAGLAALHEAGVVHRDLKPANVLLDEGIVKISDFGISRLGSMSDSGVDASAATMAATPKKSAELTGTGVVMGTPLYMAPEAAKSARQLDASADVFALGIIAYEMLTGTSPFTVPAFVLAMADQPIATPPVIDDVRVPEALRSLVIDCLRGDASQRPRMRALLAAIG